MANKDRFAPLPGEKLLELASWPGYLVSSAGRVINVRQRRRVDGILQYVTIADEPRLVGHTIINGKRYVNLHTYNDIKVHGKTIHVSAGVMTPQPVDKLVLTAFHGGPVGRMAVRHKDGNRMNDAVENLEWGPWERRAWRSSWSEEPEQPFDADGERWRQVLGAKGWEISNYGRGRKFGVLVKPFLVNKYLAFSVSVNEAQPRPLLAHVMVAAAFLGPRPPGEVVRHKDGNKKNNRLENIMYGTRAQNARDAMYHRKQVTPAKVRKAKAMHAEGKRVREIVAEVGLYPATVKMIIAGLLTERLEDQPRETDETIVDEVRARRKSVARSKAKSKKLTAVVSMAKQGMGASQIAKELGIEPTDVVFNATEVMGAFAIHKSNMIEAFAGCLREGYTVEQAERRTGIRHEEYLKATQGGKAEAKREDEPKMEERKRQDERNKERAKDQSKYAGMPPNLRKMYEEIDRKRREATADIERECSLPI